MHRLVVAFALGLAFAAAQAFEQRFAQPAFVVSAPAVPQVAMTLRPPESSGTAAAGSDGDYGIQIVATKAAKEAISTRECAGLSLRRLVAQPGMPARDSIYRAPLDGQTFLVIYELAADGPRPELHAWLLAAVRGSHCVEAHFTRRMREGEDEDAWRQAFRDARIADVSP